MARAYIERGQLDEAEPLLKEALADLTYENYAGVHTNYGLLEFKRGNFATAQFHFKKALERNRNDCVAHSYLGRCYLEQKNLTLALPQLERAMGICQPMGFDEPHYYSAIAYYRDGQKEKSRLRFEELIRVFPSGPNSDKAQKMVALIKKETP